MTLKAADSFDITVQRVYVRIGSEVRQGDVVFSASIVGYEEKMEALQKEYDEKAAQLAELERKNAQRVRVTTRTGLYQQMIEARAALHECTIDMRVLLMIEGISLTPQPDEGEQIDWIQEAVNQNASAELIEIVRQVIELQNTAAEAETVFFESGKDYSLTVTDETWNYISERDKLLDEMEQIDRQIIDLKLLERQMSAVEAPRDGYISAISIKGGESYPVSAAAYAMNAEGSMPVLRADISDTQMDIVPGAAAVIQRGSQDINTEVGTIGFDEKGNQYADIILPEECFASGGIYRLTLSDTQVVISVRLDQSTTLIPSGAVRSVGSGNEYVYRVDYRKSTFGGEDMYVTRVPVTILGLSDQLIAVAENLYGVELAIQEDKAIQDGEEVMEYID